MIDNMKTGKRYKLSMYAPTILGASLNGALLKITSTYEGVIGKQVDTLQSQILPYLPDGTPRDHTKYNYYIFDQKGKEVVLADYWIVPGTVEEMDGEDYNIKLFDVSSTEVAGIRDMLNNLTIKFEIS